MYTGIYIILYIIYIIYMYTGSGRRERPAVRVVTDLEAGEASDRVLCARVGCEREYDVERPVAA